MSYELGKFSPEHYTEHGIPREVLEVAHHYDPENHWCSIEDILPYSFGSIALMPACGHIMRNRKLRKRADDESK